MMPFVSVQVIAYRSDDAQSDLTKLVLSLEHILYPRDRWELVMIDNPSEQGTMRAWIEAHVLSKSQVTLPHVRLICSDTNDGFAGGHQRGYEARHLGVDIVCLLNQDAYVDSAWMQEAVRAFEDPHVALVQSQIRLAQDPSRLNVLGNCLHFLGFGFSDGNGQTLEEALRIDRPHFFGSGASLFVRTSALEPFGYLFDPIYFMYHEDVDLSWRMRLSGRKIVFSNTSIAYHRYEFARSIQKFVSMEQNRWRTHLSRLKWRTLILLSPAWLVMEFGALVFAVKGGWFWRRLKAYVFFFWPSTWADIKKRRAQTRRIRRVSDRQIFAHMVGRIESQDVESVLLKYLVNPILDLYFRALRRLVVW